MASHLLSPQVHGHIHFRWSLFFLIQADKSNSKLYGLLLTTVPAPPTHLQVVNVTDTRAVLQWTPSLGKVDRFIISYESSKSECGNIAPETYNQGIDDLAKCYYSSFLPQLPMLQ